MRSRKSHSRREFLRSAAGAAAALALPQIASGAPRRRPPNFVVFLSDDHGAYEVGYLGNSAIHTPQIDLLAQQGTCLTSVYTPTSICVPSRSALYTGLWPSHNGAINNGDAVHENLTSLFGYLNQAGYRTALAGKVHVMPRKVFPFVQVHEWNTRDYLRENAGHPFCLFYCCKQPHRPYPLAPKTKPEDVLVPPYLLDTPVTRRELAGYYDLVETMDAKLGRVLSYLEELGLEDDTLVLYLSDHGTAVPFAKFTLYEAGVRVPAVVRFPGRIDAGRHNGALVSFVDLVPTLLDFAGAPIPDVDGRSFRPVLEGHSTRHRSRMFGTVTLEWRAGTSQARSLFDGRYKYIANPDFEKPVVTSLITLHGGENGAIYQSWRELARRDDSVSARVALYEHRPPEELYDLEADPHELTNLADDWTQSFRTWWMRRELARWLGEIDDPVAARL